MFLKLLKVEIKHGLANFLSLYALIIFLSFFMRFADDSILINAGNEKIVVGISVLLYMVVVTLLAFGSINSMIVNFNKSMFSRSGYLTLTLPVSTSKLILSKLTAAFFWLLMATVVLSVSLLILGDFSILDGVIGMVSANIFALTTLLAKIIQIVLLFYFCLALSNSVYVKKHRGLITILLFFIISWIFSLSKIFFSALGIEYGLVQTFSKPTLEVLIWSLLYYFVMGLLSFWGTKFLIEKKIELD